MNTQEVNVLSWLPQNLDNLEKCPFFKKVSENLESQEKLLKKHIRQGEVME